MPVDAILRQIFNATLGSFEAWKRHLSHACKAYPYQLIMLSFIVAEISFRALGGLFSLGLAFDENTKHSRSDA
jgi:hypothetical protein